MSLTVWMKQCRPLAWLMLVLSAAVCPVGCARPVATQSSGTQSSGTQASGTQSSGAQSSGTQSSAAAQSPPEAPAQQAAATPASANIGHAHSTSTGTQRPAPKLEPAPDVQPRLLDDAGSPLSQSEELPSADSPSFRRRLDLLVAAIAADDAELARTAFFPVVAYAQVKAIAKPERDWEQRLLRAFKRDIHDFHRKLGAAAAGVRFVRIEIPPAKVKYMKPHSEGNRLGYHRVLRSQLVVAKADGSESKLEITSMISWRGQWYVVHLHGFE